MNTFEKEKIAAYPKFGFPQPTIIIDSQSSPILRGDPTEQVYRRMYLMAGENDLVLVQEGYPIDPSYLQYLSSTLNFKLPRFFQIPNLGTGTLTGDILGNPGVMQQLHNLHVNGHMIQFFDLTPDLEGQLAQVLHNPTYASNLELALQLGTKTGFRNFCEQYGLPQAPGAVCYELESAVDMVNQLGVANVMLKASSGIGGSELGSNAVIEGWERLRFLFPGGVKRLVKNKIDMLSPATFPLVVEQKLQLPYEGSIHVFLTPDGQVYYTPTIFGQLAKGTTYKGGYSPHQFSNEFNAYLQEFAYQQLIPSLVANGATGFHCLDMLFDPQTYEFALLEDNTRPGALDFIDHFVKKTLYANLLGSQYTWYHENISLQELGMDATSFSKLKAQLGNLLTPEFARKYGYMVLISNPDILPYGGSLNLTALVLDQSANALNFAQQVHAEVQNKLKSN